MLDIASTKTGVQMNMPMVTGRIPNVRNKIAQKGIENHARMDQNADLT